MRADKRSLAAARPVVLARSAGHCEGRGFSEHCTGVGVHLHHVKTRARGGSNDPANLAHLCSPCHSLVHARPGLAQAAGLLKHSWEDE
jgi:5-methylcytosine-specific restriction endonuclease McrA